MSRHLATRVLSTKRFDALYVKFRQSTRVRRCKCYISLPGNDSLDSPKRWYLVASDKSQGCTLLVLYSFFITGRQGRFTSTEAEQSGHHTSKSDQGQCNTRQQRLVYCQTGHWQGEDHRRTSPGQDLESRNLVGRYQR